MYYYNCKRNWFLYGSKFWKQSVCFVWFYGAGSRPVKIEVGLDTPAEYLKDILILIVCAT